MRTTTNQRGELVLHDIMMENRCLEIASEADIDGDLLMRACNEDSGDIIPCWLRTNEIENLYWHLAKVLGYLDDVPVETKKEAQS